METGKEEYVELRSTLRRLLEPINYLDFPVVIEMTTDTKFEKFTEREEDEELLELIKRSADLLMNRVYVNPIVKDGPNGVSQPIERALKDYLEEEGLDIIPPKGSGYPDMIIRDRWGNITYLEVKVSRLENIGEWSARNFNYKVSQKTKVIYDGRHLLLGFAIEEDSNKARHWRTVFWRLVDLFNLKVNLKPEFNASNPAIYASKNIIAKNAISSLFEVLI